MALVTVSSARWRRTSTPRASRVNQATCSPVSTACWPRASRRNVLPVPDGPQTTRFSRRCDPFQGAQRLLGRGRDRGRLGLPGVEGLAGGERRPRPGGWRARSGPGRRPPRRAGRGGPRRVPSVGPWRWRAPRGRGGGCGAAAAGAAAPRRRRAAAAPPGSPVAGTERAGAAGGRARLTRLDLLAGLAGGGGSAERGPPGGALGQGAGPRRPGGSGRCRGAWRGGPGSRPGRPRRTGRGPRRARAPSRPRWRRTAWPGRRRSAILTRILVVPAAAASISHSPAPSPRARNSASAAFLAVGLRSSAPGRGGREVRVVDPRAARGGAGVAGDLDRAGRPRRGR